MCKCAQLANEGRFYAMCISFRFMHFPLRYTAIKNPSLMYSRLMSLQTACSTQQVFQSGAHFHPRDISGKGWGWISCAGSSTPFANSSLPYGPLVLLQDEGTRELFLHFQEKLHELKIFLLQQRLMPKPLGYYLKPPENADAGSC